MWNLARENRAIIIIFVCRKLGDGNLCNDVRQAKWCAIDNTQARVGNADGSLARLVVWGGLAIRAETSLPLSLLEIH